MNAVGEGLILKHWLHRSPVGSADSYGLKEEIQGFLDDPFLAKNQSNGKGELSQTTSLQRQVWQLILGSNSAANLYQLALTSV